nr:ribonuclease H-like domain-containing protein [Tanacetum cinerariifolium]
MAGSDNDSDNASIHNEALNNHQQPNIQPHIITTVSNNNAKFPYLKKDEYELISITWMMQGIYGIIKARFGGNAESRNMRKSMLKQEFLEFIISKAEGLHKGYDRMQKILSQLNQLKANPDVEEINLRFLRALPSSWSQIEKMDLEEMDLKWQMAMLSRYSSFKIKEIGNKEEDSKALVTVDTLVDWTNHDSESDGVIAAKKFGMIAGCDSGDALKVGTAKLYNLITGANSEEANTAEQKWDWALQNYIGENELGWDDSAFSVFTTNSEDVEGQPIFHRFAKTDRMKAVPPPFTGDYTSLSDHTDLDESQMSYGTKSSTSCDPKCTPNDVVFCNDSDKSLEVNTNDFASNDSSVKSLEHQLNDSTSCASTSSVSTSVNEAENESNVGKPIKEPISAGHFRKYASSVSKLCFVCGSGTHLIKDCDFYENQMTNTTVRIGVGPTVRPQPVLTGKPKSTLVPTGKPKATPVPTGKLKVKPVPTGKPKVKPVPTGKPTVKPVPTDKPTVKPVPTSKPKVTPVPTGRPNRPFSVPIDRGYTPSVMTGWWSHTASPMAYLINPTSSFFQTYTPYVPTMYYNHMKYGGDRWATAVKPSTSCSWKAYRKGFHWVPKNNGRSSASTWLKLSDPQGRPSHNCGCSRSMTGNKERLDDFHAFHGGKICDKKNQVLFTDTECLVLSKDFQLPDDSMVVLKVLRKHNIYTINLNNLCPRGNLACLVGTFLLVEY